MSDASGSSQTLHLLQTAADPTRFKLLAHAAEHGTFRQAEAAMIAGAPEGRDGSVRSHHATTLAENHLLHRTLAPITYHITPLGREVHEVIAGALARLTSQPEPERHRPAVIIALDAPELDLLQLEQGDELDVLATLTRRAEEAYVSARLRVAVLR